MCVLTLSLKYTDECSEEHKWFASGSPSLRFLQLYSLQNFHTTYSKSQLSLSQRIFVLQSNANPQVGLLTEKSAICWKQIQYIRVWRTWCRAGEQALILNANTTKRSNQNWRPPCDTVFHALKQCRVKGLKTECRCLLRGSQVSQMFSFRRNSHSILKIRMTRQPSLWDQACRMKLHNVRLQTTVLLSNNESL